MLSFVGIGVARSGTSWTNRQLSSHPQLRLLRKETNVFLETSEVNDRVDGEWSPVYFGRKVAAENIYAHNPNVKLLVNLRNPVDRAWSWHHFRIARGVIATDTNFESLFFGDTTTYAQPGMYADHLRMWMSIFPKENIHVTIFDDLIAKPVHAVNRICKFLGVSRVTKKNLTSGDQGGPKTVPDRTRRKVRKYYSQQIKETEDLLGVTLPW